MLQKKRVNKFKLIDTPDEKVKDQKKLKRKLDLVVNNPSKNVTIKNLEDNKVSDEKKIYMDFEPLLCKEFKLKGYCGYGDTCKFIHSRDDYINENKLTKKHWKKSQEEKKKDDPVEKVVVTKSDNCGICKTPFEADESKKLIQLNCQHIFCRSCFMEQLKQNKMDCPECGIDSKGSMKPYKFTDK